jgi:hypothetical protein
LSLDELAFGHITRGGGLNKFFGSKMARRLLHPVMHPITFIGLLEEMIDIKVQQQTEAHLKTTPEIAAVLHQKRETDKRRLDQIRAELVRIVTT